MPGIVEKYGDKINDENYEYRQVTISKDAVVDIPKDRLLTDKEWRHLGIEMSLGWEHYYIYKPQSNVLLFRRPIGTDGRTGLVNEEVAQKIRAQFRKDYGLDSLA